MDQVQEIIEGATKIVVLTGAGVSTESGIPDFKTTDDNWTHPMSRAEAISLPFFQKDPKKFWSIYHDTFGKKTNAAPNGFHHYLAGLERNHDVVIVTQNVDGLHVKAGSSNVIEAHGTVSEAVCVRQSCGMVYQYVDIVDMELPRCKRCNKVLKPNVALFGEDITGFEQAQAEILESDLLIVAGTSLLVGPVNLLPLMAENSLPHIPRLWMNTDTPPYPYNFTHHKIGTFADYLSTVE